MDNKKEEPKQPPNKLPDLTLFEQANSDVALAASQANSHFAPTIHDSATSMFAMIESDDESEDEEVEDETDENYFEYFDSNAFGEDEDEINEFLEDQESNNEFLENPEEDDFLEEEDEIDPDELSYEELIALGEFIGVEKRGLTSTEISTCLKASSFVLSQNRNEIDRCVVCQMEFEEGESLVLLRLCDHPYHSECITNWLQTKKICPICSSDPSIS